MSNHSYVDVVYTAAGINILRAKTLEALADDLSETNDFGVIVALILRTRAAAYRKAAEL